MAFTTVDEYFAAQPVARVAALEQVRGAIRAAAPAAVETISYQIPTFQLGGKNLVHYAAWAKYISLYPVPSASGALAAQIDHYRVGKGTLRFPLDEPMPLDLVAALVPLLLAQRIS